MGMRSYVIPIPEQEAAALADNPDQVQQLLMTGLEEFLTVDKAWHGIHFVLTGSNQQGTAPLGFLLEGGAEIGEDLGYGPARLLSPDKVADLDNALSAVTNEDFDRRFDVEAMAAQGIYPDIWDEPRQELLDEFLTHFQHLRQIVHQAAEQRQAILVALV